jgi:hypothetical protein
MCTTIYWDTIETPPRGTIYTVWDLADLCHYYGRDLYEMLYEYDPQIGVTVDDNDSCLCPLGIYDDFILEDLGMEYHGHDDGSFTIISFPPFFTPVSVFEIET